jgi:carbamoyl-phosphate synthase small subunit
VFNTSMSGYQEILTDPSYKYQMLTFTYPHIGNVGVNEADVESDSVKVAGLIVRELSEHYSNYRASISLERYLEKAGVTGIGGIDTRALVLHLRTHGSQLGVIGTGDGATLTDKAKALPSMEGLNLTDDVTTKEPYDWTEGTWSLAQNDFDKPADAAKRPVIAAIDFGIKQNILRLLVDQGFRVKVFPARASAQEILACNPAGVFLSNGPGDPAAVTEGIKTTKELLENVRSSASVSVTKSWGLQLMPRLTN